ncbi:MAG: helix-turn-helix domain-containing protein [Ramlibacter sp.]
MIQQRAPSAPLRPFIARLWASDGPPDAALAGPLRREHVLPTGLMHIVIRLDERPLHFVQPHTLMRSAAALSLVGGARSHFHARESVGASCSVGALLWPGTAALLFGAGAHELAQRHTALDDLWGRPRADDLRAELGELRGAGDRMALLEARLGERLPILRGLHPQVAALMRCVTEAPTVGAAVRRTGVSHRRFIADFRHAVGLAPKEYLQVQRLQRALKVMRSDQAAALADVAALAGYADQSHFGREFLAFAGVTPARYRAASPAQGNHLPIAD